MRRERKRKKISRRFLIDERSERHGRARTDMAERVRKRRVEPFIDHNMKDTGAEEKPVHWSKQKELVAGYWHLKLILLIFRFFPMIVLRILAFPVGFFYFIFSRRTRIESRRFLHTVSAYIKDPVIAKKCLSPFGPLRHIISFSLSVVEKMQSWGGKFFFEGIHFHNDDVGDLYETLESGAGVFLIGSHLGNMELLRALATFNRTGIARKIPLTTIHNIKVNKNFIRMIKELNPDSVMDIISVDDIGPETSLILADTLESGGIVTLTGDRTSTGSSGKNIMIPFLGREAPFPTGPFYLAALLKAPVYFIFSRRRGDLSLKPEYDMYVHKAGVSLDCTRKERMEKSLELLRAFAALLEKYSTENPFQWYHFYDFWSEGV